MCAHVVKKKGAVAYQLALGLNPESSNEGELSVYGNTYLLVLRGGCVQAAAVWTYSISCLRE